MIKYFKIFCLAILIIIFPSTTALAQEDGQSVDDEFDSYFEAEEETHDERRMKDYDDLSHYKLMDHADESWWDVASQTGNNILVGVRDFAWATYTIVAEVVTTIVYHMFNLDLIQMLMPNLQSFASSFAGQIINNLLILGMAFVAITVIIRGLLQQNWGAFFKVLLLTVTSLALLFSIQSERFNYIGLVDSISTDIENTIIATPPSLMTGEEINYGTTDTAINMENRVYNALLLQPYLHLSYGDTNVERINEDREEGYYVYDYLDADPLDKEGVDTRNNIAEYEFDVMGNNNVNSANAAGQIGEIIMFGLSLLVQGFIFIIFAAVRYMLQMLMILALVLLPLVLLLSLFTSFEKMLMGYLRKIGQLILYKALLVFFMIFALSIMQITYSIQDYGMIQAIVFQLVMGISVIMIYFYRNSALETVSDSNSVSPTTATSTQGAGNSMRNMGHKMQSKGSGSHSKDKKGKEFKESNSRDSKGKGQTNTQTESSGKKGTTAQGNQSSNHRNNVTQFSDYKDKQNRQQNEQQNDQVNNKQDTESQHRYSQNQTDDTANKTTNRNDNQQTQESTERSTETTDNKQQTTSQTHQANQVDSQHRQTNKEEPKVEHFKDKTDNPSQSRTNTESSSSRNAENHQFKTDANQPKTTSETQSESNHRTPSNYKRSNERNQLNRVNNNNRKMGLNRQTDEQPNNMNYQRDKDTQRTSTSHTQQNRDTHAESRTSSRRENHSKNE